MRSSPNANYWERMQKFSAARPVNEAGKTLAYSSARNNLTDPRRNIDPGWPATPASQLPLPKTRTNPNVTRSALSILGLR